MATKKVSYGVPRIQELLEVSRNIKKPVTTIYLEDPTPANLENMVRRLAGVYLSTIVRGRRIEIAPIRGRAEDPEHTAALELHALAFAHEFGLDAGSNAVLVLDLKRRVMWEHGLSPADVRDAIEKLYNWEQPLLEVVTSDASAERWWVRVRLVGEIVPMRARLAPEHVERFERVMAHRVGDFLIDATLLAGVPGVSEATIRETTRRTVDPETGRAVNVIEPVVDAAGRALKAILAMPGVDSARTTSNDVSEMYAVLGIEAAYSTLVTELNATLSFDSAYINQRHITIVGDTMTRHGHLMQLSRHGINRVETGPLVRSSFEETVETLFDAALFGERDIVVGVTPNVMLGQLCPMGGGTCDIVEAPAPAGRGGVVRSRFRTRPTACAVPVDTRVVYSRMAYQIRLAQAPPVVQVLAMCSSASIKTDAPRKRARVDPAGLVSTDTFDPPYLEAGGTAEPAEATVDSPRARDAAPPFVHGALSISALLHRVQPPHTAASIK